MADIEKVIKALAVCAYSYPEVCASGSIPDCGECPYQDSYPDCEQMKFDALELLKAMWRDLQKSKSCRICANWYKCDPNDDGRKWQFWVSCGGSCKLNWEWQGVNEVKENET